MVTPLSQLSAARPSASSSAALQSDRQIIQYALGYWGRGANYGPALTKILDRPPRNAKATGTDVAGCLKNEHKWRIKRKFLLRWNLSDEMRPYAAGSARPRASLVNLRRAGSASYRQIVIQKATLSRCKTSA
jgi:hypothetical protein